MSRRTTILILAGLIIGITGTFYFKARPIVRNCGDVYYSGGVCHIVVNGSYNPWYYASLALVGISLFALIYRLLRRKNT